MRGRTLQLPPARSRVGPRRTVCPRALPRAESSSARRPLRHQRRSTPTARVRRNGGTRPALRVVRAHQATDRSHRAIAVAHHRDDSVETLLLNLLRGTGINGLRGIRPKNGHVVRPLLWRRQAGHRGLPATGRTGLRHRLDQPAARLHTQTRYACLCCHCWKASTLR